MSNIFEEMKKHLQDAGKELTQEVEVLRATMGPKLRDGKFENVHSVIHEIAEKHGEMRMLGKLLRLLEVAPQKQAKGFQKGDPQDLEAYQHTEGQNIAMLDAGGTWLAVTTPLSPSMYGSIVGWVDLSGLEQEASSK